MSNNYTISSLLTYDNKSKVNIKNDEYINISNYLTTYPTNNSIYPCKVNNNQICYLKKRNTSNIIINNEYICLLDKSIDELIEESEFNEINKRVSIKNNNIDSKDSNISNSNNNSLNRSDFSLWVDKYAPKSFTQLLSPERINREVLKALKEWDSFIFHRHNNTTTYPKKHILTNWNSSNRYGGFEELRQRMTPKNKDKEDDNDIDLDVDDDKHINKRLFNKISDDNNDNEIKYNKKKFVNNDLRPHHKVILLCGPPGTGKTTLAHIVAKHCNYRPIEINASDDRSIDSLYSLLSSCLSSQSLDISNMSSDKEKQPNCVILDEIDGIDNVKTIQMIISLIKEPLKSNDRSLHGNDDSDNELDSAVVSKGKVKPKSKGNYRPFPVTRPIICICNDLYAPILRTFREHCLIFQFTLPTELRLVQRLKQIIDKENISKYFDIKLLTTLVNNMGYDIRATINTLQFATSRFIDSGLVSQLDGKIDSKVVSNTSNTKSISEMLNICLKDEGRDIYQIWRLILSQRDMKLLLTKKKKRLLDSNTDSKVDNKLVNKVDSKLVSRIGSQSDDKVDSKVINKSNEQDSYIDSFIAEEESFNDDYYQYMNEIEDDIVYNQSTSKSFDNTSKQSTNNLSTQMTNQITDQLTSQLNNKVQYKVSTSLSAMNEAMYAMASHDNHDLIILGLFTNLTTGLLTDPTLQKVSYLSNCYSYIDQFDGFMRSNGDGYVLLQYLSIIAGATHILTANDSSSNPKITYPHKEKEIHFKLSQNNNIIRNLIDGIITSSIRDCNYHIIPHMNNITIYTLDILPYVMGLLNPKLKSNNINSFNSYEKILLQNVSDMMLSYTLTYQTNFQFNQSSSIQLDPPINKVTSYELVDNVDIDRQIVRSTNLLSNDIKIIIQSEMKKLKIQKEIEKIKALGTKAKNVILSPNRSTIKLKTKTPDSQIKPTPVVEIIETSKSNGKVDSFFTKKRKLTNDLISKQLTNNSSSLMNNSTINQIQSKSKPLFYKYNQGFSNAVRRPVNIKEFL